MDAAPESSTTPRAQRHSPERSPAPARCSGERRIRRARRTARARAAERPRTALPHTIGAEFRVTHRTGHQAGTHPRSIRATHTAGVRWDARASTFTRDTAGADGRYTRTCRTADRRPRETASPSAGRNAGFPCRATQFSHPDAVARQIDLRRAHTATALAGGNSRLGAPRRHRTVAAVLERIRGAHLGRATTTGRGDTRRPTAADGCDTAANNGGAVQLRRTQ